MKLFTVAIGGQYEIEALRLQLSVSLSIDVLLNKIVNTNKYTLTLLLTVFGINAISLTTLIMQMNP